MRVLVDTQPAWHYKDADALAVALGEERLSPFIQNRGSIEPGKLADFVVLDGDLLTVPAERLRSIRADMTLVGGRVVFDRRRAH